MKTYPLGMIFNYAFCHLDIFFLMLAVSLLISFSFVQLVSRLGLRESALRSGGESSRKSSQSRLLCFVVTAIAKLASYHRELLPRARVSLGKVCLELFWIGPDIG